MNMREIVYKSGPEYELKLHLFRPEGEAPAGGFPAIAFFFGGGWIGGTPGQFFPHCEYLASRGMIGISAEYRVRDTHGTTPFECVADGKSALRYLYSHAEELEIDPERIAAGGGSAGAHVAAATATVPGLDEPGEDTTVPCRAKALVLFNPVYDNGPEGYGYDRIGERYPEISPRHNLSAETPPTLVLLGTEDDLIPVATAEDFRDTMRTCGVRSELCLYERAKHGFFNYREGANPYYAQTVIAMDRFLASLGLLSGEPTLSIPE
ncbi:MAG: alpha/beta hydrolase family protein [Planctomycetota bacterium]|jgi:acetyl esterase/lipase